MAARTSLADVAVDVPCSSASLCMRAKSALAQLRAVLGWAAAEVRAPDSEKKVAARAAAIEEAWKCDTAIVSFEKVVCPMRYPIACRPCVLQGTPPHDMLCVGEDGLTGARAIGK